MSESKLRDMSLNFAVEIINLVKELKLKKERLFYALLFGGVFVVEVLIALFVRDNFVRPYVGDMLVTVLLCALLRIFSPKSCPFFLFMFFSLLRRLRWRSFSTL